MARQSKSDLPTKVCPTCGRPFAWRKKWARDWDRVVYCSDACRRGKEGGADPSTRTSSGGRPAD